MTSRIGAIRWTLIKHSRILLLASLLVVLLVVAGSGEAAAQHSGGIEAACGVGQAENSGLCGKDFSDHPGIIHGNHG